VSGRGELFLGIIAAATLVTAMLQIGVLVAMGLLVRRVFQLVDQIDKELKPIFESVQSIARDASRAASLATAQVERIDRALGDLMQRLDRTLSAVQNFVSGPAKNVSSSAVAWVTAFKSVFTLIRDLRASRGGRSAEDEDALFI
jgi:predicted PurR-regulated permease PerM